MEGGANQDYVLAGGKPDPNVPVVEGVNVPPSDSNNPGAFTGVNKRGHKCCTYVCSDYCQSVDKFLCSTLINSHELLFLSITITFIFSCTTLTL